MNAHITVLAALALHTSASTAPPVEWLEQATVCRSAGDFACADVALTRARETMANAPWQLRWDILEFSAEIALALERVDEARTHISALIALDPAFSPGRAWAPAWRRVVEEVRASLPDASPPTLDVATPDAVAGEQPIVVRAIAIDPSGVARVLLHLGDLRIPMLHAEGDVWVGVIPAGDVTPPRADLRVEAWDIVGNGPTLVRVSVPVTAPESRVAEQPLYERWWFWTLVGAASIGVGVGAALALDGSQTVTPSRRVVWGFR